MAELSVLTPASPAAEALARAMAAESAEAGDSSAAAARLSGANPRRALQLIAGWLSTRESVWWGCLCAAQILKAGVEPGPAALLAKVLAWVKDPTPANRDAVGGILDIDGDTPAHLLARAVSFTTDNLSPCKEHPVACPTNLAHRMVAMAVLACADLWPGPNRDECEAHFVDLGLDVSEGLHLWAKGALPLHPGLRKGADPTTFRKTGNIWEKW